MAITWTCLLLISCTKRVVRRSGTKRAVRRSGRLQLPAGSSVADLVHIFKGASDAIKFFSCGICH
jgi:hypothetical protein